MSKPRIETGQRIKTEQRTAAVIDCLVRPDRTFHDNCAKLLEAIAHYNNCPDDSISYRDSATLKGRIQTERSGMFGALKGAIEGIYDIFPSGNWLLRKMTVKTIQDDLTLYEKIVSAQVKIKVEIENREQVFFFPLLEPKQQIELRQAILLQRIKLGVSLLAEKSCNSSRVSDLVEKEKERLGLKSFGGREEEIEKAILEGKRIYCVHIKKEYEKRIRKCNKEYRSLIAEAMAVVMRGIFRVEGRFYLARRDFDPYDYDDEKLRQKYKEILGLYEDWRDEVLRIANAFNQLSLLLDQDSEIQIDVTQEIIKEVKEMAQLAYSKTHCLSFFRPNKEKLFEFLTLFFDQNRIIECSSSEMAKHTVTIQELEERRELSPKQEVAFLLFGGLFPSVLDKYRENLKHCFRPS